MFCKAKRFAMYRIGKQFEFSSCHQLFGLAPGHKCGRRHGHNYKVQVVLRSDSIHGKPLRFTEY